VKQKRSGNVTFGHLPALWMRQTQTGSLLQLVSDKKFVDWC
jgi:hypothetical protein